MYAEKWIVVGRACLLINITHCLLNRYIVYSMYLVFYIFCFFNLNVLRLCIMYKYYLSITIPIGTVSLSGEEQGISSTRFSVDNEHFWYYYVSNVICCNVIVFWTLTVLWLMIVSNLISARLLSHLSCTLQLTLLCTEPFVPHKVKYNVREHPFRRGKMFCTLRVRHADTELSRL